MMREAGRGWPLVCFLYFARRKKKKNGKEKKSNFLFPADPKTNSLSFSLCAPRFDKKKGGSRMPSKPARPCREPGCPNLAEPGKLYCKNHKKENWKNDHVQSANKRGYTYRWQQASRAYLRAHPLCVECQRHGRYTAAEVVDHIVPHRGDYRLFWDQGNWQALCKRCHDEKTGREDTIVEYRY